MTAVSGAERHRPSVLRIKPFRKLAAVMAVSSTGDWLTTLAQLSFAAAAVEGFRDQSLATGGVLVLKLLPAVLLLPLAGVVADRFDRRWTMVTCDVLRGLLVLSIPLVGTLQWLLIVTPLIETVALFWQPTKDAALPNLVPRDRVPDAVRVGLFCTYGTPVVSAAVLAVLAVGERLVGGYDAPSVAFVVDAVTFAVAAALVATLPELSRTGAGARRAAAAEDPSTADHAPGGGPPDAAEATRDDAGPRTRVRDDLAEGLGFVRRSRVVRGVVVAAVGAFAAAGVIIAASPVYVRQILSAGDATFAALFGCLFTGLVAGFAVGSRWLPGLSRRRFATLSVTASGACVVVLATLSDPVPAAVGAAAVGLTAGAAYVNVYALISTEVDDAVRGRVWALLQSVIRVSLLLSIAATPWTAALIGQNRLQVTDGVSLRLDGVTVAMLLVGTFAVGCGLLAYRLADDGTVPLRRDLRGALRTPAPRTTGADVGGLLVVLEGGEGSGKSTQCALLVEHLRARGHDVVTTREPGDGPLGPTVRGLLLGDGDGDGDVGGDRAEALLFAADRAAHVERVLRPALAAGSVVVCDRYVDSSRAYQAGGRGLDDDDVTALSAFATRGLTPDLTVLLDLPVEVGLARARDRGAAADRLEAEDVGFHRRVRAAFRRLAAAQPERYLVVDASAPADDVAARVREAVGALLPVGDGRAHRAEVA